MKDLGRALLAIGAGVVLGAGAAAQFEFFWWLGMLVGGPVAYLICDWPGVVRAVRHAWKWTMGANRETWKGFGLLLSAGASVSATVILATFLMTVAMPTREQIGLQFWLELWLFSWVLFTSLILFADDLKRQSVCLELLRQFNPVKVYVYWPLRLVFRLVLALPQIMAAAGKTVRAFGLFVSRVFAMIHSEARFFCLVDAAIGVAVFHCTGNNLLWGLVAGEALGVLGHLWVRRRQAREIKRGLPV